MKRVYVKEEVCIACGLCEVYCQLEHSKSKDLIKAFKKETPGPLSMVSVEERKPVSVSVRCQHCDEPACVYACLTGALSKDPVSGEVSVDTEKCIGCWTCVLACPYGAIKRDKNQRKMVKCDFCAGRDMPACVVNCPNEALVFIDIENEAPTQNLSQVAVK